MTSERLRDAFALLLREKFGRAATLNADAERAIRRRVGLRWTGLAAVIAMVGGLGAFAIRGATGDTANEDLAMPSLARTPTPGIAIATFPFEGGPEFETASSAYGCGDSAPTPQPQDHDLSLTVADLADETTLANTYWSDVLAVRARITQTTDANLGVVSTSGIDYLVVKDGIVVGILSGDGPVLKLFPSGHAGPVALARWTRCPGDPSAAGLGVEPGNYEVVAVARVFSTPESVALAQALGLISSPWLLSPAGIASQPGALYLPGSYDCGAAIARQQPARPCLADYNPEAVVHTESKTVSLIYRTGDLVDQFITVLISEPLTVKLAPEDTGGSQSGTYGDALGHFEKLEDFTCGASAAETRLESAGTASINLTLGTDRVDPLTRGGTFEGTVMTTGVVDGSRVALLPDARVVYFENARLSVSTPDGPTKVSVNVVAGWAPVTVHGAVTVDRYTGPQQANFTTGPATLCPGIDSLGTGTAAVVGTWRISSPIGSVATVDLAADAGFDDYGWAYAYVAGGVAP